MKVLQSVLALAALMILASPAAAQRPAQPWMIEGHAGYYVPTFDVADLAKSEFGFGGGIGYFVTDRILLFGEVDYSAHSGNADEVANLPIGAGFEGADVKVLHFMGKIGYTLYTSPDSKLKILVNAGAGALNFDVDLPEAESKTYFAINAGAKLYYMFSNNVGLVVSPQGDIAFTSEDDGFTGSTAWVWPFSAGIVLNF